MTFKKGYLYIWLTFYLIRKILWTEDDVIVILLPCESPYASRLNTRRMSPMLPGPRVDPVSGGWPGCGPWHRTGRCGRTAPWGGRDSPSVVREKCFEDAHRRDTQRETGLSKSQLSALRGPAPVSRALVSQESPRPVIGPRLLTLTCHWRGKSVTVNLTVCLFELQDLF